MLEGRNTLATSECELPGSSAIFVHRFSGATDGPRVAIVSGLHGDEWYGPAALTELLGVLAKIPLRGTVTLIPAANPSALSQHCRINPDLPKDLNRYFVRETRRRASPIAQHAKAVWNEIASADIILDVHSCGVDDCVNHARILQTAESDLAASLAVQYAMVFKKWPKGLLIGFALQNGKRALALEYGTAGDLQFERVSDLVQSLLNFLRVAGALEEVQAPSAGHQKEILCLSEFVEVPVDGAGIFEQLLRPGVAVQQGDTVGRLRLFGTGSVVDVQVPSAGRLLIVRKSGPIGTGASACTIV